MQQGMPLVEDVEAFIIPYTLACCRPSLSLSRVRAPVRSGIGTGLSTGRFQIHFGVLFWKPNVETVLSCPLGCLVLERIGKENEW